MTKKQIIFVVILSSLIVVQGLLVIAVVGLRVYKTLTYSNNIIEYFPNSAFELDDDILNDGDIDNNKRIITMDEAVDRVMMISDESWELVCYETMRPGQLLDEYPSENYYIVYIVVGGEIYMDGCFYVNMYTGEIYVNEENGDIFRLSDNTYVGTYGQLPKVNEF